MSSETMQALMYEGPRTMNMKEVPMPIVGHDDVLIKVAVSGICGSELSGYLGQNSLRKPPLIMGHEFSGEIVQVGEHILKEGRLAVGQRVIANPLISCYRCEYCLSGRQHLCNKRALLGAHLPGSYAQYVKVPATAVYSLADHLSFEEGALAEPLACAVNVAEMSGAKPDDIALIIGMGPIGLFVMQALKLHGVNKIIAVDRNEDRLSIAEQLGATIINAGTVDVLQEIRRLTSGSNGVTVAVDAVGADVTRNQCVQVCAPGGRVVFTGLHESHAKLPINDMIRAEISVMGSFAYSASHFTTALKWLEDGRIQMKQWVVKETLGKGQECFERLLTNPGPVAKILLVP